MGSSFVPPELVDATIDHLHDDIPTLAACSLVHRQWLSSSRYHLFSRISFAVSKLPDFLDLIEENAQIRRNVRELRVHYSQGATFGTVYNQTLLFDVLDRLPALVTLRLNGITYFPSSNRACFAPWQPPPGRTLQCLDFYGFRGSSEILTYTLSLFGKVPVGVLRVQDADMLVHPDRFGYSWDYASSQAHLFASSMVGWRVGGLELGLNRPSHHWNDLFCKILAPSCLVSLEIGALNTLFRARITGVQRLKDDYGLLFEQFGVRFAHVRLDVSTAGSLVTDMLERYLSECSSLQSLHIYCGSFWESVRDVALLIRSVPPSTKRITFGIQESLQILLQDPSFPEDQWTYLEQGLLGIRDLQYVKFVTEIADVEQTHCLLRKQIQLDHMQRQLMKEVVPKLNETGLLFF